MLTVKSWQHAKVLKASRLKRGEVKLHANEDIMFMWDHAESQWSAVTSAHIWSLTVCGGGGLCLLSVNCSLCSKFLDKVLLTTYRFPSHACIICHLFFFQFHILSQWPIAFHVMWEEKGSSVCLVSDMLCHLRFFVWALKGVCQRE